MAGLVNLLTTVQGEQGFFVAPFGHWPGNGEREQLGPEQAFQSIGKCGRSFDPVRPSHRPARGTWGLRTDQCRGICPVSRHASRQQGTVTLQE